LKYDKILILGASGGIILPLLKPFQHKFILNFGGLDWQRSKWSHIAKIVLKKSEKYAVNNSSELISDNEGIKAYIKKEYRRESILIEYGGDQAKYRPMVNKYDEKYHFIKEKYVFSVARIQPDNNIEMILKAFSQYREKKLILVGNWNNSEYGKELKNKYNNQENIFLLDAIYDQEELDTLRSNCALYVHGHSAGGTNPSLVEAMNLSLPIIAFASAFNKYTTENKGLYFNNEYELIQILKNIKQSDLELMKLEMKTIASRRYKWSIICNKYKEIFQQ
jgi:glycosyltransferase involved in cell wall biosynthesis